MKRLCAWAAPGNGTPVQAAAGARVILSQWAWYARQRTGIAPDLHVATGEAANG